MAGGPVDPTMPLPPDGGEGGEPALDPTEAGDGLGADATGAGGLPGAYDPTIAVPPVVPPGGGPGDGDGDEFAEDGDNRRKWLYGALAALGVVVLGVLIALLLSGGGDDGKAAKATTTSTSTSTSTTTTTTTTTTTAPGAPVITSYSSNPSGSVMCNNTSDVVPITLMWATSNANGVTITIDGGATASFPANGSAARDFNCSAPAHSYALTAVGANNATAARTITLTRQTPPTAPPTTALPPTTTTT